MEPRGLTGNMFLSIQKENRLNNSSTTEELVAESPTSRLGKGVKLPDELSRLRQKLGLKAKQEHNSLRMPRARVFGKAQCGKTARWV